MKRQTTSIPSYVRVGFISVAFLAVLMGVAFFMAMMPGTRLAAAPCSGTQIAGTAFRDLNANGLREAAEAGIAGIIVTAYSADGAVASCETTANGAYAIDAAGSYPVRLEFSLPADNSLSFLQPGPAGADSATTVTFVNGPASGLNVGFNNPGQYCGDVSSTNVAVSCLVFGEQNDNPDGVNKERTVLYNAPYSAGSTNLTDSAAVRSPSPTSLAVAKQAGSTWGLAWSPNTRTIYSAAFMKRHAGFGPGGAGAIYQTTSAGTSLWHNFGAIVGADPHPQPGQTCLAPGHNAQNNNFNCWLHDSNSFDLVGKVGFGDLDISEDFSTLYTINLADKMLLQIPISNPGGYSAVSIPTPTSCPATDLRPFGLGVNDGAVYVGMVCSAESTQNSSNLRGYVYAYRNNAFSAAPVLEFPFYGRGSSNMTWNYWLNRTTFNPSNTIQSQGKWGQPWLTDIVFDHGDMILAIRDRNADQFGVVAGGPDPNDSKNYTAISRGDVIRACANGSTSWTLESNGKCGSVTTAGAGNSQGPGGGEYYWGDAHPTGVETALGALAYLPGAPDVLATIYDPINLTTEASDAGFKWLSNSTGAATRSYLVYDGSGEVALFDKANGLGDVEALCAPAPIEIGNRVWNDSNVNGVQDAGEAGIDGVTVELYRSNTLVGATTTTNGGLYLFNNSNVNQNGATGILPGTGSGGGASEYEIRIPGYAAQPALAGLIPTTANADGAVRDSNGTIVAADVVYAIPHGDLISAGYNNHTYDFGFTLLVNTATPTSTDTPTPTETPTHTPTETPTSTPTHTSTALPSATPTDTPTLQPSATSTNMPFPTPTATITPLPTLTPTATNTAIPPAALGNFVWIDANKNGAQDKDEIVVPNVTVSLYTINGTLVSTTTTNADGIYLFTNLTPGDYYVSFKLPSGYNITAQDLIKDDEADSDVDTVTFRTPNINLGPNEVDLTWDMGIFLAPTELEGMEEPAAINRYWLPIISRASRTE